MRNVRIIRYVAQVAITSMTVPPLIHFFTFSDLFQEKSIRDQTLALIYVILEAKRYNTSICT